ncbi:MAG: helix-turn-helix domain-containing protein [Actinobacteria bacterium]|nr:helix-turn-helix domain-containing protein [Actinomycetota bacterium]
MLSVPEAARRTGKNPETIRRWIRSGRLPSSKIGTQHFIEAADLDEATGADAPNAFPPRLRTMYNGRPMPDWVALVREQRDSH